MSCNKKLVAKLFLQIILLVIFLTFFGEPSIHRLLDREVIVLDRIDQTESNPAPDVTVCGRSKTTGPYRESLCSDEWPKCQAASAFCEGAENEFRCLMDQSWKREDIVLNVVRGHTLNESMMKAKLWNSQFPAFFACHTLSINAMIGANFLDDDFYFALNKTLEYNLYLHDPDYFIPNYNPLALPHKKTKILPNIDCKKHIQFALTEHQEYTTARDPCVEETQYSFNRCIQDSIARKVGCGLKSDGGKLLCTTQKQFR